MADRLYAMTTLSGAQVDLLFMLTASHFQPRVELIPKFSVSCMGSFGGIIPKRADGMSRAFISSTFGYGNQKSQYTEENHAGSTKGFLTD